jgi:hypothetical protein
MDVILPCGQLRPLIDGAEPQPPPAGCGLSMIDAPRVVAIALVPLAVAVLALRLWLLLQVLLLLP